MNGQTEWPALLADLKAKRDALTQLITVVETHFVPVYGELPASPVAETRRANPGARPPRPYERRQVKVSKPASARPVSVDLEPRILAALKSHGAMSPVALATKLDVHRTTVRPVLAAMATRRAVVVEGATHSRRVRLPGPAPAKEGL
jgi:hypothetical protein